MEDLAGLFNAGGLGLAAFGSVCILMLLTGRLITLREHRETRADRDFWRTQATQNLELARQAVAQNDKLLQGARLATDLAKALPTAVEAIEEQAKT